MVPPALDQFRRRWRTVAGACVIAACASLGASLLLPRKYTATTRILVEPPAGSDVRVSTAVSPIYLESLRTYEAFAASDDLFLRAAAHFGLRDATPIDRLKKSVLKVNVPRNTKILEVNATLIDPKKAHDLALYIGQEAVKLNREVSRASDREMTSDAEKRAADARAILDRADKAWSEAATRRPVEQLTAQLQADVEVRARIQRQLISAQVDVAEAQVANSELPERRARAAELRSQFDALDRRIAAGQVELAARSTRMDQLAAERKSAQAALKSAETHLEEVRSSAGYRGERLNIIDPGIVPERPSSPNIPLNVFAAVFAALVLSVLYILAEISFAAQRAEPRPLRIASGHD
jgi:capsule polysaccharide export protein KpsE/RkpR